MPRFQIFQIDAFAEKVFCGNPAAVCPLERWLEDATLQAIAQENNLAETAFFVPTENGFQIRWFTPMEEVPLCGHATLASGFVLFTELAPSLELIRFESKSGPLSVSRKGQLYELDFPAYSMAPCTDPPKALLNGLNEVPEEIFVVEKDPNYFALFANEETILAIKPDMSLLEQLHPLGVVITAPGTRSDCVSRYFAPSFGIPEDPVTGSIHSALVPYWAGRLKKSTIHAYQASKRGGHLYCEDRRERVSIAGNAVKYASGHIHI